MPKPGFEPEVQAPSKVDWDWLQKSLNDSMLYSIQDRDGQEAFEKWALYKPYIDFWEARHSATCYWW